MSGQDAAPPCSSKKRDFKTKGAALRALRRLQSRGTKGGKALKAVYRCRECGWWHLTSTPHPHGGKGKS